MELITLQTLKAAFEAGDVIAVTLLADGPAFQVQIRTSNAVHLLADGKTGDEVQSFVDPRSALLLLGRAGIQTLQIDSRLWHPAPFGDEDMALSRDQWLHKKVQASIDGLHDGSNAAIAPDEWETIRSAKRLQRDTP